MRKARTFRFTAFAEGNNVFLFVLSRAFLLLFVHRASFFHWIAGGRNKKRVSADARRPPKPFTVRFRYTSVSAGLLAFGSSVPQHLPTEVRPGSGWHPMPLLKHLADHSDGSATDSHRVPRCSDCRQNTICSRTGQAWARPQRCRMVLLLTPTSPGKDPAREPPVRSPAVRRSWCWGLTRRTA